MAQPTVNSRPATWSGTSGPILYKFTSTNYANAGYRMEVEIWDATAAAKIADAKYYANSSGVLTVDVSAFLKSELSLNLTADLTSGTVYEDGNWVTYYIKYQEVWTASSESQVDDVGNSRNAIYGGLQLGASNTYLEYITTSNIEQFITESPVGAAIVNYPFLISFYGIISTFYRASRYLNNVLLNTTETAIPSDGILIAKHTETGDADKVILSVVNDDRVIIAPSAWSDVGTGYDSRTSTEFISSTSLTTDQTEQSATQSFVIGTGSTLDELTLDVDLTSYNSGSIFVKVELLDSLSAPVCTSSWDGTTNQLLTLTADHSETHTITFGKCTAQSFVLRVTSYASATVPIGDLTITPTLGTLKYTITDFYTVNILPECTNVVMLTWRNSLGGWECFPFIYNQEYTWHYSDRKAKRLTLYADNLTLSQWEAIQGLNTLGELYKTPITEMTTSLDRTSATIGQSIYVLNSDGTKTGVNVIGQPNTTFTKRKTHSATVIIEYPELFLQ